MAQKIDFAPAIIAGTKALAAGIGAALKKKKQVEAAWDNFANSVKAINDELAVGAITEKDAKRRLVIAKAALSASIASYQGVAETRIANAVNAAAVAFLEVAKTALSNSFPL